MNDYDVKEIIGKGSFGDVFLAYKRGEQPRKAYVLKRIKLARQTPWQREATAREINLMQSLRHPFIVPFVESWTYNSHTVNVVLGYCEQGDLGTIMLKRKKPYDEQTLRRWLAQMLLALDYLEQKNVLHRDIKTGNIFLCKEGHVQLGDFGLASVKDGDDVDAQHDQSLVGTPHFMSPELLSQKGYDCQTDVWSLGCVMYELSAMKPAFNAFDLSGLIQKITKSKSPALPPCFSQDWSSIVRCMLRKDPANRPTVQQLLALPSMQHAVAETRRLARSMQPDVYLPPMAQSPLASPSSSLREHQQAQDVDMDGPEEPVADHQQQQQQQQQSWAESLQAVQSSLEDAQPAHPGDAAASNSSTAQELSRGVGNAAATQPTQAQHQEVPLHPHSNGRGVKRGAGAAGVEGEEGVGASCSSDGIECKGGGQAGHVSAAGQEREHGRLGVGHVRGRGRTGVVGGGRGGGGILGGIGRGVGRGGTGISRGGRVNRDQGVAGRGRRPSGPALAAAAPDGAAAHAQHQQLPRGEVRLPPGAEEEGWGSGVKEAAGSCLGEGPGQPAEPPQLQPPQPQLPSADASSAPPLGMDAPSAAPSEGAGAGADVRERGRPLSAGRAHAAAGNAAARGGNNAVRMPGAASNPSTSSNQTSANGAPARSGSGFLLRGSGSRGSRPASRERASSANAHAAPHQQPHTAGAAASASSLAAHASGAHSILDRAPSESKDGQAVGGSVRSPGAAGTGGAGGVRSSKDGGLSLITRRNSGPGSPSTGEAGVRTSKDGALGGVTRSNSAFKGRPSKPTPSEVLQEQQQHQAALMARKAHEDELLQMRRQQQAARTAAMKERKEKEMEEHRERLLRARQARNTPSPARRPPSPSGRSNAAATAPASSRAPVPARQSHGQLKPAAATDATAAPNAALVPDAATAPDAVAAPNATAAPPAPAGVHEHAAGVHEFWSPSGGSTFPAHGGHTVPHSHHHATHTIPTSLPSQTARQPSITSTFTVPLAVDPEAPGTALGAAEAAAAAAAAAGGATWPSGNAANPSLAGPSSPATAMDVDMDGDEGGAGTEPDLPGPLGHAAAVAGEVGEAQGAASQSATPADGAQQAQQTTPLSGLRKLRQSLGARKKLLSPLPASSHTRDAEQARALQAQQGQSLNTHASPPISQHRSSDGCDEGSVEAGASTPMEGTIDSPFERQARAAAAAAAAATDGNPFADAAGVESAQRAAAPHASEAEEPSLTPAGSGTSEWWATGTGAEMGGQARGSSAAVLASNPAAGAVQAMAADLLVWQDNAMAASAAVSAEGSTVTAVQAALEGQGETCVWQDNAVAASTAVSAEKSTVATLPTARGSGEAACAWQDNTAAAPAAAAAEAAAPAPAGAELPAATGGLGAGNAARTAAAAAAPGCVPEPEPPVWQSNALAWPPPDAALDEVQGLSRMTDGSQPVLDGHHPHQQQQQEPQQQQHLALEPMPSEEGGNSTRRLSQESTALSLPTPSHSGVQIYYGNEDAEEQQHLEYQGSKQVGLELNKPPVSSSSNPGWDHSHAPTSIYPNQAADAVKFVSGPAGLLGAHGEAGVRPGTDRDAAADVQPSSFFRDLARPQDGHPPFGPATPPQGGSNTTMSSMDAGDARGPSVVGATNGSLGAQLQARSNSSSSCSSSQSSRSNHSKLGVGQRGSGWRSAAAAAGGGAGGLDSGAGGSAWKGMFSNAMFGEISRHPSEPDMVPLDAPPSESHTPQAAHSSEHVRTPGLVQAFPLQVGTERSYQDESDDEELPHRGLEDWSTPVQARSAAGQAPHASYPQADAASSLHSSLSAPERKRLHCLEQALQEARALLKAGRLSELGELLETGSSVQQFRQE